jgi:hypothetical protein
MMSTVIGNLKLVSGEDEDKVERPDLRVVTVLRFLHFVIVFYHFFDWFQLDGTYRDYFEVATALRAGNDFALVNLFLVDIQIGLTFRAINHNGLRLNKSAPVNI